MKLKEEYEMICNKYLDAFCEKYNLDPENTSWMGKEIGEFVCCESFVIRFDNLMYMVDNDIPLSEYQTWNEYYLRMKAVDKNACVPNFDNWCRGCPRKSEIELAALEYRHFQVEKANDRNPMNCLLFNEIKDLKLNIPELKGDFETNLKNSDLSRVFPKLLNRPNK